MNQLVWNKDRKSWVFVAEKPRTRALTVRQRTKFRSLLLDLHGPNCWLCNRRIVNETPTLDHIEPRSLGGRNELSNLRLAHGRCNMRRGSGPVPELLLTRDMRLDRPQGWQTSPRSKPLVETTKIGSMRSTRAGTAPKINVIEQS